MSSIANGDQARHRLEGIDGFRAITFVFIVALHANDARLPDDAGQMLELIPRFGVPFFFLVSGYFLKIAGQSLPALLVKVLRRMAPIYVFWVSIYLLVHWIFYGDVGDDLLGILVHGGPAFHLWFLPSLGISLACVAALILYGQERYAISICLLLYAIGLYFVEFKAPFGPVDPHWNFRNGPFFGAVFVCLGYLAKTRGWKPAFSSAIALILCGLVLSGVERYALVQSGIIAAPASVDYYIGTLPFGLGVFALALSLPSYAGGSWLAFLGRYTLGYYCIHLLFLWLSQWLFAPATLVHVALSIVMTTVLSVVSVLALSKIPAMRRLIS